MLMSKLFVQTLREFPNDAEAPSHKLLVRAGYIKKLTSGIYSYLPLMQRVLAKVSQIIREEMNKSGAQEILMPFVQPAQIWEKSGRWSVYGKELARLKDRSGCDMCLAPTHEEVVTSVVGGTFSSYKQLPVNLYQIQTKFRDEIRPRFGLLRGREFIMKDAYSFHATQKDLDREYGVMARAYTEIFNRCGLETKMVQSDSGAIGGAVSHEFMVLTDTQTGENDVFYCGNCAYSANSNHATSILQEIETDGGFKEQKTVDTPNTKTIEDLAKFLNIKPNNILKSVFCIVDNKPVLVMIRGDKEVEETKLLNAIGGCDMRYATDDEAKEHLGADAGYLSFFGIDDKKVRIIFDNSARGMKNFVIGANEKEKHIVGYNFDKMPETVDVSLVKEGEKCPECGLALKITRGIEVGNIFQLGTKYSEPMEAFYTDENGESKPYIMGCYGIGVTRVVAAAIEKYHDDFGIIWPYEIAPYHVVVVPPNTADTEQMKAAYEIYEKLLSLGVETVLDDRDERAGVKFKDADLIGFPIRITTGKTLSEGLVELKIRKDGEVLQLTPDEAAQKCLEILNIKKLQHTL